MPLYIVKQRVTGDDHDGYCSGQEADKSDESNAYITYKIVESNKYEVDRHNFVKDEEVFNYENEGCTSLGGSNYCEGFHQIYTTIWARIFKNEEYNDTYDLLEERYVKISKKYDVKYINKVYDKLLKDYNECPCVICKEKVNTYKYRHVELKDELIIKLKKNLERIKDKFINDSEELFKFM